MEKKFDAKDVLTKDTGKGEPKKPLPEQPTNEEIQEAASPELSSDEFSLGDRTFKIRISNIITQKIMAKSLDAITDLIKKVDLQPIFGGIQERMNKDRKKLVERLSETSKDDKADVEAMIKKMADEDETSYLDMIELIKDIITHGGISNIIGTIIDLYTGIVFAICKSQDKEIKKEWVEENLSLHAAQDIFFKQMKKDRMGGKVIDFLYVATQQVVNID